MILAPAASAPWLATLAAFWSIGTVAVWLRLASVPEGHRYGRLEVVAMAVAGAPLYLALLFLALAGGGRE